MHLYTPVVLLRFPSMLRHCWLGDRKGICPIKLGVGLLIVTFDWSFACLIAPVVTTTSIILSTIKKLSNH